MSGKQLDEICVLMFKFSAQGNLLSVHVIIKLIRTQEKQCQKMGQMGFTHLQDEDDQSYHNAGTN